MATIETSPVLVTKQLEKSQNQEQTREPESQPKLEHDFEKTEVKETAMSTKKTVSILALGDSTTTTTTTAENTTGSQVELELEVLPVESDYDDRQEFMRCFMSSMDRLYPTCKWPLHDTWTFWHVKNDTSQHWSKNVKEIIDISYVEDFWSVINNLYTLSTFIQQGDVMLFKKGIRPMWEDEQNKTGGSWLHQLNGQSKKLTEVYDFWLDTLLNLIGDQFCEPEEVESSKAQSCHVRDSISGVYACHRGKMHKLSLWTLNYKDEKNSRLVGKLWKRLLKIKETDTITFEAHKTKNNKSAQNKIVYKE